MKKKLVIFMTVLALSVLVFSEVKIGIVNAQKLVEGSKKGKAIAQKFEKLQNEKQGQYQTMQNEIKKLESELASPALSNAARETKAIELQNKRTALKRFTEDSQREWKIKFEKEMSTLKMEIFPIIQQIGKDKGFTVILEVPAVTYFDPAIEITDEIIKVLDSK